MRKNFRKPYDGRAGRRGTLAALSALFCFLSPVPALASSTVSLTLPELARQSSAIVHGTVLSTTSHWNEDHSLIVTEARVRVSETLRGRPEPEVTVVEPGGRVGKLRVDVDGAAALVQGEEAVLFLARGSRGAWQIVGLERGRYPVERNPVTGELRVQGIPLQSFLGHVRDIARDLPQEADH
jgi:hypothetical protein